MYEYDKEHWKEALYDAVEFDEMEEEDETDDLEEACHDMIDAGIDVLVENALYTSKLEYFKKFIEMHEKKELEEQEENVVV